MYIISCKTYTKRDVADDDIFKVDDTKKKKEKSIQDLLKETDDMFKEIQDKQTEITTDELDVNLNVDDDFNFDQYINQQNTDND